MSVGLFDLPTPLLAAIDQWLAGFLAVELRLCFWALVSAVCSVLIYKALSNQEKIDEVKTQIKTTQKTLQAHDGEFAELKSLAIKSLRLSLRRLRLTALPALLSVLPVVFVLVFLSSQYDYVVPETGQSIDYQITWEDPAASTDVQWSHPTHPAPATTLYWPAENAVNQLSTADGRQLLTLPASPVPMVHKRQWWNVLMANPAGYLSDDSPIQLIAFDFQSQPPGVWFARLFDSWHWPYFILTFVFSILLLIKLKVRF